MEEQEKAGAIGGVVARRRDALPIPRNLDVLTIAIGTYPRGLSLAAETRLSKAALLYADRVVLYSAAAALLASVEELGRLNDDGVIAFLRQVAPAMHEPTILQACDMYEVLRRKRRRSRDEILATARFKSMLRQAVTDFGSVAESLLADAGAAELAPALKAGVVEIDPLVAPDGVAGDDDLSQAYFHRLGALLSEAGVYPLFDDETGDLVRAGVVEGLFEIPTGAERRGKQVGAAAEFIVRIPALPGASMAEVLDVRAELHGPLKRFRISVIRLSRLIESSFLEEDFSGEAQDVYDAEVAPALEEIAEAFITNSYLKEMAASTAKDVKTLLAGGAALTLGLAGIADVPTIAATSIGVASAAGSTAVQASFNVKRRREEARRNQVYFLYQANKVLESR
jgi:hypothetical protein